MHSRSIRLFWSLCIVSQLLPATIFASSSGGYGGNSLMGAFGGGGSSGYGSGGGRGGESYSPKGPVTAAVETHRSVEVKPVQMTNEPHEPQVIEVPSDDTPVVVHFKSQSSRVLVQQTHTPAEIGEPEHTSSEDQPQRVIHEVVKPVIQEIREVIQPYRRVVQQIQPVLETTHTIIAKGEPRGSDGSGASSGAGVGGGKSYGSGGGNYAAAASTVSLKSAPTNSESVRGQVPAPSASSASHQSNANSGRKFSSAQIQQIFQQSPSNTYSARRGDLREPQATQTRISLRPALVGYNSYYRQPVVQAVQPVIQSFQPSYGYSEYKGALSAFHEEDLPLMTFVAKPARFRARARA